MWCLLSVSAVSTFSPSPFINTSLASSKASSSESTASNVNGVTVSDTDVSVPARKKTMH